MITVAHVLIGLSALAFVTAAVTNYFNSIPLPNISSEGYSRAAENLALLAIALLLAIRTRDTHPR